jgi:hypothetical protein
MIGRACVLRCCGNKLYPVRQFCRTSVRAAQGAPLPAPTDDKKDAPPTATTLIDRMRGGSLARPPAPPLMASAKAGLGAFIGIGAMSTIHFGCVSLGIDPHPSMLLIGSMGASAALLYGGRHSHSPLTTHPVHHTTAHRTALFLPHADAPDGAALSRQLRTSPSRSL